MVILSFLYICFKKITKFLIYYKKKISLRTFFHIMLVMLMVSRNVPSWPILSISLNVRPCVCPSVSTSVRLSVWSLLRYSLNVFDLISQSWMSNIFQDLKSLGKKMKRNGLIFEIFKK